MNSLYIATYLFDDNNNNNKLLNENNPNVECYYSNSRDMKVAQILVKTPKTIPTQSEYKDIERDFLHLIIYSPSNRSDNVAMSYESSLGLFVKTLLEDNFEFKVVVIQVEGSSWVHWNYINTLTSPIWKELVEKKKVFKESEIYSKKEGKWDLWRFFLKK